MEPCRCLGCRRGGGGGFTHALSFLGSSRVELEVAYEQAFSTQVSAEMLCSTPVGELLMSKGKRVFLPDN
jgi:hypothetical protein